MFIYIPFLAELLGYAIVAKSISDYLQGRPSPLAAVVPSIEAAMAQGGFTGEQSPVYEDENGGIVHATEHEDGVDACLAIYGPGRYTTLVEGPTIMAMYRGAKDVNRAEPRDIVRQVFVPKEEIQQNLGRLNSEVGYLQSTVYRNLSDGLVDINYTRTGTNTGRIKIYAESGPGLQYKPLYKPKGIITYDNQFDFSFPTA
ncbi:MAG: hypothetical protein AAF572_21480 [Cyanobacteria bacterium P01_B01_bin.77]